MLMRPVVTLLVDDSLLAGLELEHIKYYLLIVYRSLQLAFGFQGGF